jgi:NIF3 (NGG1p interacting factor 3)
MKSRFQTCVTRVLFLFQIVPLLGQFAVAQHNRPTAREVVAAIQKNIGIPWNSDTVDTFKAGNPDIPVTGVAVTMMATLDVLERAAAKRENLIITHEPTFFDHLDKPAGLEESDPVWKAKRTFIENHGLVVWRFHDHWHLRRPDGILSGVTHTLNWEKYHSAANPNFFTIPETLSRSSQVMWQIVWTARLFVLWETAK